MSKSDIQDDLWDKFIAWYSEHPEKRFKYYVGYSSKIEYPVEDQFWMWYADRLRKQREADK